MNNTKEDPQIYRIAISEGRRANADGYLVDSKYIYILCSECDCPNFGLIGTSTLYHECTGMKETLAKFAVHSILMPLEYLGLCGHAAKDLVKGRYGPLNLRWQAKTQYCNWAWENAKVEN